MSLKDLFEFENWNFNTQHIIENLSAADFKFLIGDRPKIDFKKGEDLFVSGTAPTGFYFIHKGRVKKRIRFFDEEISVYIAGQGELVGYHGVLSGAKHSDTGTAIDDCVVSFIPSANLKYLLANSVGLYDRFLTVMAHEFTVMLHLMALNAKGSPEQKITTALIIFREKSKRPGFDVTTMPFSASRMELALFANTGEATTSRVMTALKKENIIEGNSNNRLVRDLKRLTELTAGSLLS